MDLNRYTELYLAETDEHLRTLGRRLLELESGGGEEALDDAFRAAHTIKGMSAAMGYDRVAERAHALEDRLDGIRAGRVAVESGLVDELLASSDALERAVRAATGEATGGTTGEATAETESGGADGGEPAAEEPEGEEEPTGDGRPAPQSVRVPQHRLDELVNRLGELGVLTRRLERLAAPNGRSDALSDVLDRGRRLVRELHDDALAMRMVPVGDVFDRFPRVVRDAARALDKEIDLEIEGRDIELDRQVLEEIADPLIHLLRNAVDHGIGTPAERREAGKPPAGRLLVEATRERSSVVIRVEDDGRGVSRRQVFERAREAGRLSDVDARSAEDLSNDDVLRLMSRSGLSTAETVTEVSGRGVGMDVVASRVRRLGGALDLRTEQSAGTAFSIRLPITLALAQALRVRVGGEQYAIPLTHIAEVVELAGRRIERVRGREVLEQGGELLPVVHLGRVLEIPGAGAERAAVVAERAGRRAALAVSELVGRERIVIKDFDAADGTLPVFSGVTLSGDGRPALVLDPVSIL